MKEPEISPDFTIEDIHKIREYDAERREIIGDEAYWAEVRADSLYVKEKIKEARERRLAQNDANVKKAV
ncbi:MAG: hypothetical protein LBQ58_00345 [Synergistaceae bacterium]|jgi:hypothetical protein|nr:hypothetical protein [Synergistaceae bacterium]